jgi:hypothetical protein
MDMSNIKIENEIIFSDKASNFPSRYGFEN